eukprot:TRINITY_DN571_c9_g1_i1.p1 TRINITY_DN571_c9_g1~~TRINITY_DN571_c9_g1_i1.p1  ORF type:complete len:568 (+),score=139.22 TRINITY_DN571_c9_g1_i1:97-1704(+)
MPGRTPPSPGLSGLLGGGRKRAVSILDITRPGRPQSAPPHRASLASRKSSVASTQQGPPQDIVPNSFRVTDNEESAALKERLRFYRFRAAQRKSDERQAVLREREQDARRLHAAADAGAAAATGAVPLVGLGCPALDLSGEANESFFKRHRLEPGDVVAVDQEGDDEERRVVRVAEALSGMRRTRTHAAGACLNALRIAQRLLQVGGDKAKHRLPKTLFIGAASDDQLGQRLREHLKRSCVAAALQNVGCRPTGVHCQLRLRRRAAWQDSEPPPAYVCTGGAGGHLDPRHVEQPLAAALKGAHVLLVDSAACGLCPDAALYAARTAAAAGVTVALWVSSATAVHRWHAPILQLVRFSSLVFSTRASLRAIARASGWAPKVEAAWAIGCAAPWDGAGDTKRLAQLLQASEMDGCVYPPESPGRWGEAKDVTGRPSRRRAVVMQGSKPAVVADPSGIAEYPTTPVQAQGDAAATGDAFVGGYLARFCAGGNVGSCVEWAQAAAQCVLAAERCILPMRLPAVPGESAVFEAVRVQLTR